MPPSPPMSDYCISPYYSTAARFSYYNQPYYAKDQMSEQDANMQRDGTGAEAEKWNDVRDPQERRKIQNKLAQRRFREKQKDQREENERQAENQRRAGSAYTSPDGRDLQSSTNLSGLPWGGVSMGHIVESGKAKEQRSQQSSRENSVYAAVSRTGGSSRVGLHLTDHFARGAPAWRLFPFNYPFGHPEWGRR